MNICPLCKSNNSKLMYNLPVRDLQKGKYTTDIFNIYRCGKCGIGFIDPMPTDEDLKKYYSTSEDSKEFMQENYMSTGDIQSKGWNRALDVIEAKIPSKGKILDVGCGPGWLLDAAIKRGWDCYGNDVSDIFCDFTIKKLNLQVQNCDFLDINYPKDFFNVITMFDFIEHVKNPKQILNMANDLLIDNGLLVIATADIGSLCARFYGLHWRQIIPIGHIFYFNKKSMINMLHECGFKIIKVSGVRYDRSSSLATIFAFSKEFIKFILRIFCIYTIMPIINFITKRNMRLRENKFIKKILNKIGDQAVLGDVMKVYAVKLKKNSKLNEKV